MNTLFDLIKKRKKLTSDTALAKFLGTSSANISKMRRGQLSMSCCTLVAIHDRMGWTIKHIRELAQEKKDEKVADSTNAVERSGIGGVVVGGKE